MTGVSVYRGLGNKVGAPVVCPLLSEAVLVDYGTHLMNKQAHAKSQVEAAISYRSDVSIGQLVAVATPAQSEAFRGKVTGISFTLSNGEAQQQLVIEKVIG